MRSIPRFWATAEGTAQTPAGARLALRIWGWSTSSLAEATTVARERLAQVASRAEAGETLGRGGYYPRLPLREETLREITAADGTLLAVITRNRYGAEVLNSDAPLIADVDLPQPLEGHGGGSSGGGFLSGLFGRRRREEPAPTGPTPEEAALERIAGFAAANPHLGVQTYRTRAGLRVLITGGDLPPGTDAAERVLRALESDPVYVLLCRTHETYRARLTPKPWRCGHQAATFSWPHDEAQLPAWQRWLEGYTRRSRGYATTRKLSVTGPAPSPAEVQVITVHDEMTRATEDLPLA